MNFIYFEAPCYDWKNEISVPSASACPPTCEDVINGPGMFCDTLIEDGCVCIEDYVRGPNGFCIPPSACELFQTTS